MASGEGVPMILSNVSATFRARKANNVYFQVFFLDISNFY